MECVLCEEVITNPLCPCCLHAEMEQWLREQGKDGLIDALRMLTASMALDGETHCISCGHGMGVCAYCYTRDALSIVKHDPRLLTQYLTYFNFDLGHLGWEQEALAWLGVEHEA